MTTWRVQCDCGYVVEDLTAERAARFCGQHADDEHEPEVVSMTRLGPNTHTDDGSRT